MKSTRGAHEEKPLTQRQVRFLTELPGWKEFDADAKADEIAKAARSALTKRQQVGRNLAQARRNLDVVMVDPLEALRAQASKRNGRRPNNMPINRKVVKPADVPANPKKQKRTPPPKGVWVNVTVSELVRMTQEFLNSDRKIVTEYYDGRDPKPANENIAALNALVQGITKAHMQGSGIVSHKNSIDADIYIMFVSAGTDAYGVFMYGEPIGRQLDELRQFLETIEGSERDDALAKAKRPVYDVLMTRMLLRITADQHRLERFDRIRM